MFIPGHNHAGPEVDFPLRPRAADRVHEPLAGAILGKEGAAMRTSERQGVRVTRYL